MSLLVIDGVRQVLDDEGFQVLSQVPGRVALADRFRLEKRRCHRLRVTFNGLEDTSPLPGGSGTVVGELVLSSPSGRRPPLRTFRGRQISDRSLKF